MSVYSFDAMNMCPSANWASCAEALSEGCLRVARAVYWFVIENRFGLAFLVGLLVVPSQWSCNKGFNALSDLSEIWEKIECKGSSVKIERFGNEKGLSGVIYYPKRESNHEKKGECILYHAPNGVTSTGWFLNCENVFLEGFEETPPGKLAKSLGVPVILYDYRGTGLSGKTPLGATYESVVKDGQEALQYALKKFDGHVYSVGTSLGGGVAVMSLDRHLNEGKNEVDASRITLVSHNSFASLPRVILPNWPRFADWLGWLIGAHMNAEAAVQNLKEKKVKILILSHAGDEIIPLKAQITHKSDNKVSYFQDTVPQEALLTVSVEFEPDSGSFGRDSSREISLSEVAESMSNAPQDRVHMALTKNQLDAFTKFNIPTIANK